jgi:hypothetical protein
MNWVLEKITKYTGVTDAVELSEIYGHMSDNVRAFSSLTASQLRKEAKEAKALNDYLKTDAGKAEWAKLEAQIFGA